MKLFDISNTRQLISNFQKILFFMCLYLVIVKALENANSQWIGRPGRDNSDIDEDACLPFCKEKEFETTLKLLAEGAYDAMKFMQPIFKVLAQEALNYCAKGMSIPNTDFSPCTVGTGATPEQIKEFTSGVYWESAARAGCNKP
jgi:hypothetical protein